MRTKKRNQELDRIFLAAIQGYQINILDLSKVSKVAEDAWAIGADVTQSVHDLLDKIATKVRA